MSQNPNLNNPEPGRAQAALRRLVLVIALVLGVVIYAYGWQATNISLEPTQDQTRQDSVSRAMRELLSPNIFTQDREIETVQAVYVNDCDTVADANLPASTQEGIFITLSPNCGTTGSVITVIGQGYTPNADTIIRWVPPTGQIRALVRATTDANGVFTADISIPNVRGVQPGDQFLIEAEASWIIGSPRLSETSNLVVEKMIETIFLALMATTLALPISVVLSFLAAHNLMKPIKMPAGSALVGLVLLPVGWFIGATLIGQLGTASVEAGKSVFGLAASAVIIFGSVTASRFTPVLEQSNGSVLLRSLISGTIALIVGVALLGVIGGFSVWLGEQMLATDFIVAQWVGNFINTIGRLVELTIVGVAGLGGALFLANSGMRAFASIARQIPLNAGYILAAILGGVGGAIIMYSVGSIAIASALMSLLTPLTAALLGAPIAPMLYGRITGRRHPLERTQTDRFMLRVLQWLGFLAIFALTYLLLNSSRALVEGRLPLAEDYLPLAAAIGAVFGAITGGMTGVHASMPIGTLTYNVTRTILNALRSIEPLIMGIVFVIWVGIGPFAGVLALTLHSIASLGKLYSEQIENIDEGPIEALQSTGANRVQTIIYAVVPQIIPPYIAFTLYRWDINVRMSTIIGFVGGGGIGFLLQQQINLLRYRDAGVAVLAIAIVVSILDYASAAIRERIM